MFGDAVVCKQIINLGQKQAESTDGHSFASLRYYFIKIGCHGAFVIFMREARPSQQFILFVSHFDV